MKKVLIMHERARMNEKSESAYTHQNLNYIINGLRAIGRDYLKVSKFK